MSITRHSKFPEIPKLDSEIDLIIKQVTEMIGKVVNELPAINQVPEGAIFYVKQTDSTYFVYKKIAGQFRQMKVDNESRVYYA